MLSEDEKKKREEEAKTIISSNSIGDTINSINYANSNNLKINTQNEDEQNFINKVNEANDIINSINPRQNISAPSATEEEKLASQQTAQKFLDLIDGSTATESEKQYANKQENVANEEGNIDTEQDNNRASGEQRNAVNVLINGNPINTQDDIVVESQEEEKEWNLLENIKSILSNLFHGGSSGAKQMLKYNEIATEQNFKNYKNAKEQQYLTSQNVSDEDKAEHREATDMLLHSNKNQQIQLANNNLSDYGTLIKTPNSEKIETNLIKQSLQDSIDQDTIKIQENIANTTDPVARKLAELTPSIGQMTVGWGASAIHPMLGISYFMTSAGGSYIDEAKERGMDDEEAFTYGTVMGAMEGITEEIEISKLMKGGKALSKGFIKEALKEYGLNAADNFIQEAIMEPISEATATIVGGKDTADWSNMAKRMWQSGIDGALTSLIMDGASAGINSSVYIVDKIKNNKKVSTQELQTAMKDISNSKQINIQDTISNEFNYQIEQSLNNENYTLTRYNSENDNLEMYDVQGQSFKIDNDNLNISPAVVKVDNFYNVIDSNTGLELYTTSNIRKIDTIEDFKKMISNLDEASIKNINSQITQTKLSIANKTQQLENNPQAIQDFQIQNNQKEYTKKQFDDITKTISQISDKSVYNGGAIINTLRTISNNVENVNLIKQSGNYYLNSLNENGQVTYQQKIGNRPYTGKKIKEIVNNAIQNADTSNINISQNTNTDIVQTSSQENTANLQSQETSYTPQDVQKIIEPFNSQEKYTKNEMAKIWNEEINANDLDVLYDSNGNIHNYISIEEDGDKIYTNLYDSNDNLVKSEVILSESGKYTAEAIRNTIEKVTNIYDENKLIKGQVNIEGNEVTSMKKEKYKNATELIKGEIEKAEKNFNTDIKISKLNNLDNINLKKVSENEYIKLSKETFKNNISKRIFHNNNANIDIKVVLADIKESSYKAYNSKYQNEYLRQHIEAISQIDKIISNGIEVSNNKEIKDRKQYKNWRYFTTQVMIENNPYLVQYDVTEKNDGYHFRLQRLIELKLKNKRGTTSAMTNKQVGADSR